MNDLKIAPKSKYLFLSHSGPDTMSIDSVGLFEHLQCLCHASPKQRFIMCAVAAAEWANLAARYDNLLIRYCDDLDVCGEETRYQKCNTKWMEAMNMAEEWRLYGSAKD